VFGYNWLMRPKKPLITKSEARAWKRRWKIINDFERKELRRTPLETKLRQLAAMMRMARELGLDRTDDEEVKAIRKVWVRMKRKAARGT